MTQLLRPREAKEEAEANDKRRPRLTYWLAGILAFCLVLTLVGYVVGKIKQPDTPVPQSVQTAQFVASGDLVTEVDPTQIVPADTTWSLAAGPTAVPTAPEAGPVSTAVVASGFAHSPSGALFALSWFTAEVLNPAQDIPTLVNQRIAQTTGYTALVQRYTALAGQPHPGEQPLFQTVAYRLLTYTPDAATIILVQRNTTAPGNGNVGDLVATTYNLAWNGDWLIVPPIDGHSYPLQGIPALTSLYVPFQGA